MNKKKFVRTLFLLGTILILLFIIYTIIINSYFNEKGTYTLAETYTSQHSNYSIEIYTRPEFLSYNYTVKVICINNENKIQKKIIEKSCGFHYETKNWFEFKEYNDDELILELNTVNHQTYKIVWSNIFKN